MDAFKQNHKEFCQELERFTSVLCTTYVSSASPALQNVKDIPAILPLGDQDIEQNNVDAVYAKGELIVQAIREVLNKIEPFVSAEYKGWFNDHSTILESFWLSLFAFGLLYWVQQARESASQGTYAGAGSTSSYGSGQCQISYSLMKKMQDLMDALN